MSYYHLVGKRFYATTDILQCLSAGVVHKDCVVLRVCCHASLPKCWDLWLQAVMPLQYRLNQFITIITHITHIKSIYYHLFCICRQRLMFQAEAAQPSLPQQGCPLKAAQSLTKQPVQQQPLLTTMGLLCCTRDLERCLAGCSQWRWMMTPCSRRNSPRLARLTLHK